MSFRIFQEFYSLCFFIFPWKMINLLVVLVNNKTVAFLCQFSFYKTSFKHNKSKVLYETFLSTWRKTRVFFFSGQVISFFLYTTKPKRCLTMNKTQFPLPHSKNSLFLMTVLFKQRAEKSFQLYNSFDLKQITMMSFERQHLQTCTSSFSSSSSSCPLILNVHPHSDL